MNEGWQRKPGFAGLRPDQAFIQNANTNKPRPVAGLRDAGVEESGELSER